MNKLDIGFLILQSLFAASLFVSGFCRLAHTDGETILEIRAAVVYQTSAAVTLLAAPWLPLVDPLITWAVGTTPAGVWLMLLSSGAFIQIATSRHWFGGVPRSYIKPECRPMRRNDDFQSTLT